MSGTQKSCCMNRPASVNECCHSATGSAMNRARDRSTCTLSAPSGSAFRWDGTTRSSPPSRTTSNSPRSSADRGRLASGTAAPSPSTPMTGSLSQAKPPVTARSDA